MGEAWRSGAFAESVMGCPGFNFILHKPRDKRPGLKASGKDLYFAVIALHRGGSVNWNNST